MDTGFRRYDGSFVPIRCPDRACRYLFEEERKERKKKNMPMWSLIQNNLVP